jgi:hypothetical protein
MTLGDEIGNSFAERGNKKEIGFLHPASSRPARVLLGRAWRYY